jgi:hypothetical protein
VLRDLDRARKRRGIDVVQHDLRSTIPRRTTGVLTKSTSNFWHLLVAATADDRDARARWCCHRATPYAADRTARGAC